MTSPSSSTARHRYIRVAPIRQTISSNFQRGKGAAQSFRKRRAISGPNLMIHHLIVS
jgi:hypothetical protein